MKSTSPAGRTSLRAALVDQLERLFEQAEAAAGAERVTIDVAGRLVSLRFAGRAMAGPLLPAVEHLSSTTDALEPELTIDIWDSESTGVPSPVAPWGPEEYRERGIIRSLFGDGFFTIFDRFQKGLTVVDTENGRAYYWLRDARTLGLPDRGAPLRTLFNLWLAGGDTQLIHGAAVGRSDGCVLLIGPSGAGKSSTALSCLDSPLGHLGEDYCLVTRGDPPVVSSIYSSAKLRPEALERLPHLRRLRATMPAEDDFEGKALLDLHAAAPERLLLSAPLAAIAVPRIAGGPETSSARSSSGAALAAVAPSTMLQLPGNGEPAMRWLAEIVSSVPCYELELGSDPQLIPAAIEDLLAAAR